MRVWIVNPFDPIPGESVRPGRYAFISEQLSMAGHEVVWWSSNFFHALKKKREERAQEVRPPENLRIVLLPTPPYTMNVSFRRLYNHYIFARQFAKASLRECAPDVILASFPPIGSSLESGRYARRTGARVVLDVQDLWPEAFELFAPRLLRRYLRCCLGPFRRAARQAFAGADGIVGVSRTYIEYGLRHTGKHVPSLVLPLGVDLEAFDGRAHDAMTEPSHRQRCAVYVGTIGRSYDLQTVIEAGSIMRKERIPIALRIAGDGPNLPRLRRAAERRALDNIVFYGLLPFDKMASLLRESMVGLHSIAQGSPQTLTNKLFEYLAAGLPVLNSSPGEASDLLEKEGVGVTYPAGDADALCKGLATLMDDPIRWQDMSAKARQLAVERYDRRKIYRQVGPFLEGVCAR